tara:strand:+ start:6660 stop:7778 length:1119 start_codon:yes stop_codon:yes gene_type:complete
MINIILQNSNLIELIFFSTLGIFLFPVYLNKKDKKMDYYVFITFLSFILILVHSIVFSFEPLQSSIDSILAILKLSTLYLIIKIIEQKNIQSAIKLFFIFLSIITILPSNILLLLGQRENFTVDGNFKSIFANANMFAMYLSIFVYPYILYLDKFFKSFLWGKYFYYFLNFNIFYLILISGSRINLGLFIIASIFFYLNDPKKGFQSQSLPKAISILSLSAITLFVFFNEFLISFIFKNQLSIFTTRIPLWLSRINAISEKPFFGWGYNVNEFYFYNKYTVFNELEKGSTILAMIEEFGIFLGILLIIIFILVLYNGFKQYSKIPHSQYLGLVLLLVPFHLLVETWILNFNSLFALFIWFLIFNILERKHEQ